MSDEPVIYEERQKLNIGLLWLPVLAPAVMVWYTFYQQVLRGVPVGSRPAPDFVVVIIFVVFGLLFPYLMLKTRLILQVRPDGFYFRYHPFHFRYHKISWLEIKEIRPVEFSPIKDFGGYGIKFARGAKIYTASGNRGLEIKTGGGRRFIFSSQNPEKLMSYMDGHWHRKS